jgi:hypothetical protein
VTTYEDLVDLLETELDQLSQIFGSLDADDWGRPTLLRPLDETLPPWTLFELAGHFDLSIGLARGLLAQRQSGQVARDRVSFFIFPRSEVAPILYDLGFKLVLGKVPSEMAGVLRETFSKTIEEVRNNPPETVGPAYFALMRLDDMVASRVVEAVVHGLDLTDALGRRPVASHQGLAVTAALLDELLARRTVAGRPADLADDLAWVRAASGRSTHPDPRLPLLG